LARLHHPPYPTCYGISGAVRLSGPRQATGDFSANRRVSDRRSSSAATRRAASPASRRGRTARRGKTPRRHYGRAERLWLAGTAIASALVLIVSGSVSEFFGQLNGNITTESMSEYGANLPPASKAGVLNVLALGSQTRDGQGHGFGHDPGTDLSDTAMVIHVNAAHTRALVLSIPRDLLVHRPPCRERVGGSAIVSGAQDAMFDSAMNLGGPACAVATVQDMSGIRIDHFIRLDFNGFRTMTDVLGGVQVCVPRPGIHDWRSHLNITPGLHVVSGNEALAFVRDRHGIGNGGDLGRIKMQQMFVSSLIRKVMSSGTLSDPVTLYRIANAATRSVTTDPGLGSVQALLSVAESMRGLKLRDINFLTLPNQLDPANIDRLIPTEPAASQVWRLLRADLPWTGRLTKSGTPAKGGASSKRGSGRKRPAHGATSAINGINGIPAMPPSSQGSAPGAQVQARNASENICSGLPTPNNLGG
jgi:LCP family protein required for cell wall assembly